MVEILHFKDRNLDICEQSFAVNLPNRKIEPVRYKALPRSLKRHIDDEQNCGLALRITHPDDSITLVAEVEGCDIFYLQDRNRNNRYLGEGRIYIESVEDLEIPVVGYTFTAKLARKKGVGTRRLFTMNALSQAVFENPINSSSSPRIKQKAIWERLVRDAVAETHILQGNQRYKFKDVLPNLS